ncbi:MAG: hypothetical protein SWE60_13235, partial [Thermodesulfobacteriota bacterium]|nr:hypothetical protein [Thermodesulfobacteriota bacterium]
MNGNFLLLARYRFGLGHKGLFVKGCWGCFGWPWGWGKALHFSLALHHFGEEADFGPPLCKGDYVSIFQIPLLNLFSIDERAVGAMVNQLLAVAFSNDLSMFSGDKGQV